MSLDFLDVLDFLDHGFLGKLGFLGKSWISYAFWTQKLGFLGTYKLNESMTRPATPDDQNRPQTRFSEVPTDVLPCVGADFWEDLPDLG